MTNETARQESQQIQAACAAINPISPDWLAAAHARQSTLTKPAGSLGELEKIGNRIAAISETTTPPAMRKRMYVVAGDHGVTAEGVSAYPPEVTRQMVFNFLRGGAAINVLARHGGIEVQIVDAGVDFDFPRAENLLLKKVVRGAKNIARGPAMTRAEAEQGVAVGIELAHASRAAGIGLLGIGEMGIGNTTAASAITAALTGKAPAEVTGRGTGLDDDALKRKIAVVERALALNSPTPNDAIDMLAKVGGAEIAVMMGIVIGAAAHRLPIVADGFISTAAAALAVALCPGARDYLFVGHLSQEQGHKALVEFIGVRPILDLDLRLGEGTGAALAMHIIEASARLLREMATFTEAGVAEKGD